MIQRKISRTYLPMSAEGFLGKGHVATPVINGQHFENTDPFILLMDDQLDLPGDKSVGGAHPHAGFETVTLVLEGDSNSGSHTLHTGSMEWMTAGSGIIHTETIDTKVKMRILQLWLVLPKAKRWASPKWQGLNMEYVPIKKVGETEIRVYSGSSLGMIGPMQNQTPTTIVDFSLERGYAVVQEIPATYNGFIYVIEGSVEAGLENTVIGKGQVAWLDKLNGDGISQLKLKGGEKGGRFVLYAGEPQGAPIVMHGPFIGDTQEDIVRLYSDYRQGEMEHVRDLPASQSIHHT